MGYRADHIRRASQILYAPHRAQTVATYCPSPVVGGFQFDREFRKMIAPAPMIPIPPIAIAIPPKPSYSVLEFPPTAIASRQAATPSTTRIIPKIFIEVEK